MMSFYSEKYLLWLNFIGKQKRDLSWSMKVKSPVYIIESIVLWFNPRLKLLQFRWNTNIRLGTNILQYFQIILDNYPCFCTVSHMLTLESGAYRQWLLWFFLLKNNKELQSSSIFHIIKCYRYLWLFNSIHSLDRLKCVGSQEWGIVGG